MPVARRQAHRLRPRDFRDGRRRQDLGAAVGAERQAPRRRRHRARRDRRESCIAAASGTPYQKSRNISAINAVNAAAHAVWKRKSVITYTTHVIATARQKSPAMVSTFE